MNTILVVDDMAIFRDPITATLRAEGYHALCAASGAEALRMMKASRPDLVMLDVAMPKVDGLTVLRAMRGDAELANVPVIVLTAHSDKRYVMEAAKLGAKEYLLKSRFSLAEMLERVRRHLGAKLAADAAPVPKQAAAPASVRAAPLALVAWQPPVETASSPAVKPDSIPKLLTREQCIEKVQDLLQARTLSGVVAQVIAMAASPRTDMSELSTLVARDAMLSAKVLRAANSAAYTSSRGIISTVADAVRNVGCSTVRNIAASFAIYEAMPETGPDGFNPIRCWQHCFAVANLCSTLAEKVDESSTGTAYLIGLCHDLGSIVFHTHFGQEYKQLLELQARTGRRKDQLERIMFGMSHNELVSTILRCIGLPDSIRGPIEAFHGAGRSDSHQAMSRLLRIANGAANGMLLASSEGSQIAPLSRSELQLATSLEDPPAQDPEGLRNQILCITGMLARLSREEEQRLMAPLFPRRNLRVWLAREAHFSTYDPVQCALQSIAECHAHECLPSVEELDGYNALVVVARGPTSPGLGEPELKRLYKALGGRPMPLLWLAGRPDGPVDPNFRPAPWPISLCHLDQFLAQAESEARGSPAEQVAA